MTHTELACFPAGLVVVGRYKQCSHSAIGSACGTCQDDVPHRTSHRQARLAVVARYKLPNQHVRSCLWRSPSRSHPPRSRRVHSCFHQPSCLCQSENHLTPERLSLSGTTRRQTT
jgi:hypothetical protein